jgi:hypothetical protein
LIAIFTSHVPVLGACWIYPRIKTHNLFNGYGQLPPLVAGFHIKIAGAEVHPENCEKKVGF